MGQKEAKALIARVNRVIVAKGKKVTTFNVKKDAPNEIAAAMLGPTGNLRAPTIQVGKTLLVGFNQDTYKSQLM